MKEVTVKNLITICFGVAVIAGMSSVANAQWGNFKGQVVFKGDVPKVDVLVAKGQAQKDPEVCAANENVTSQELVIDPKTKGIANCVIYLSRKPTKIHPDLAKPPKDPIKFDNVNCVFEPHVLVVHKDSAVHAINSDACGHNVKTNMIRNKAENQLLGPKDVVKGYEFKFRAAEFLPMKVECNIHPWMNAYWYVVDHPYAVVTDKEGNFEIKNLPAGRHTFKVWQEKAGYLERSLSVTIEADKTAEKTITAEAKSFK